MTMMMPGQVLRQLYKAWPLAGNQTSAANTAMGHLLTPRYTAWGVGNTLVGSPREALAPWVAAGISPEALQLLRFEAPQEVLSLNALKAGLCAGEGERVLGPVNGFDPPPTINTLLDGYANWVSHEQAKAAADGQGGLGNPLPVMSQSALDAVAAQHQLAHGEAVSPDVVASLMRAFEDRHGAYSTNYFLQSMGYVGKQVGPVHGGFPVDRTILFGARLPNALGEVDVASRAVRWRSLNSQQASPGGPAPSPPSVSGGPQSSAPPPVSVMKPRQMGGNTQVFGPEAS